MEGLTALRGRGPFICFVHLCDFVTGYTKSHKKSPSGFPEGLCGGRGIRTPGPREGSPVFKTGAFDHSAIPPLQR